ncbi:hypothetical protein CQ14_01795 [Bradyrhizobium lablabi]|uniref:UrcA family protein n=1 Tax=Bradyrhizobium lablabi TaxID=722472 RepID=A0A0R3MT33_9BRAD|nr:hypothetical protein [Bradyrhizobium lablabi]KRR23025.1 hypothetical protein CQ14_01795 [Bradyrhizobium lablabi]
MRVFIAISIVVASVSFASAQTADAARAVEAAWAAAAARAAANAYATPYRLKSSFYVGGSGTMKVTPRTAEDLKADEAGQAAWNERCRPTVIEDREGLRRVTYAERDCDLSRFNTAGN